MVAAICNEVTLTPSFADDATINSIYFGGGTPSLLSPQELNAILDAIKQKFTLVPNVELTLEANPDDVSAAALQHWLQAGINRLSLGIQSFNDAELKWMNRAHNALQSIKSIELIQAAGFKNFTVDLIYGSPYLSNDEFKKNIAVILEKSIPHVSAYALTVEEKTALYHFIQKQKSPPVDETHQESQFELLTTLMENNGYEQYEISNFARPGFRSRHNSSYWQGKPYYGFGPAAHSFDGHKTRRWNVANNALYIQAIQNNSIPLHEEILTDTERLNEAIMIGLRTMEGVSMKVLEKKFGARQTNAVMEKAQKYLSNGLLIEDQFCLRISKKGKFLADGIAADLFF